MTLTRMLIALSLGGLVACGANTGLTVDAAWVRLAPPGAATAGYLKIVNRLDEPVQLTGASAEGFGAVMIHETRIANGQARMVHAAPLIIAAHSEVEFSPGGLHLMLMQPQAELAEGDAVKIELQFAGRESLTVDASVRASTP